jgi:hypothetical protein
MPRVVGPESLGVFAEARRLPCNDRSGQAVGRNRRQDCPRLPPRGFCAQLPNDAQGQSLPDSTPDIANDPGFAAAREDAKS